MIIPGKFEEYENVDLPGWNLRLVLTSRKHPGARTEGACCLGLKPELREKFLGARFLSLFFGICTFPKSGTAGEVWNSSEGPTIVSL